MPDYTLQNVYAMTDFETSEALNALQDESTAGAVGPADLVLRAGATAQQMQIADADGTHALDGDHRQLLTAPITLDGITYPAGSIVAITAVLTDTQGGEGYAISIGPTNAAGDRTTAFVTTTPVVAGRNYRFTAGGQCAVPDSQFACYAAGTMIKTARGERAIETLQVGDRVMTRDHGLQTLRWTGTRTVAGRGRMAPVTFDAGILGCTSPLSVSPNHRMLISGAMADLVCGDEEILLSAKMLINDCNVRQVDCGFVTYVHIMFDYHEIIWANDCPSESSYIGDTAIASLPDAQAAEILSIFPDLRKTTKTASLARAEGQTYEGNVIASTL